ncbi:TPA: DNA (cytosine-5-)-methyltransferase [Clostridium botulinum]|nr:DNA (cytosine-5-)-methyltransferase [Clostridium botulinum]HBJ1652696.1 DNA (cytosine-5-)-methyltransferase [Clostridium botulinum]
MNENKPILVGGIGEINFGKQWRQGNRVYDSENIAMCLMSQPIGNAGGFSYLYTIQNKLNNEGVNTMKEFTNNLLKKFNFKMDEIKIFDSFAGIGSMHNSLKFLGVPTKIIGLSETDVDATISYAGIHIDNFIKLEFKYPSENQMREWLMNRNIGWDFQKQKSCIPRLKKAKLYKVYKASVLLNNLGDISQINYKELPDFDLFNFSFPCTDLSNAGKQKGLKNEDGTPTRSGLVKYGIELIKTKKPKYIMIENVKALIQKKFIGDFYDIVNEIEDYGYKCYYPKKENGQPTCLNAKDYGIAQNRERIFVICVRNDVDNGLFEFPKGFDSGLRLKDFLENTVEDKYFLSEEIQNRFKLNGNEDEKHDTNEIAQIEGMNYKATRSICNPNMYCRTLDTMGGGQREPKTIELNNNKEIEDNLQSNFRIRKLTPKECWRLMGFTDKQFDKAKELGISDSQLYKQEGNSIVVNVLYYIFKELFKKYIIK